MPEIPVRKAVRVGFWRRGRFRPLASIGVSRDGGIFVAPAAVRDYTWTYGVTQQADPLFSNDHVTVSDRPKLHYHRSGWAFVTLTGKALPRRVLQLPPIGEATETQIMSLVVVRPWELVEAPVRVRDITVAVRDWPDSSALYLSLLHAPGVRLPAPDDIGHMAPMGLLPNDDSTFLVDLSYYLPGTLLAVRSVHGTAEAHHLEPSITVAAIPWDPEGALASYGVLALWSSTLRNPLVARARPDELLSLEKLADADRGTYPLIKSTHYQRGKHSGSH